MKYSYDNECFNLAIHFFGEKDPRLVEIAQAIQDTVEQFPDLSICDGCGKPLRDHHKPLMTCNPTAANRTAEPMRSEYRYFHFKRFRDGREKAEGAVAQALTEEEALARVRGWYSIHDTFKLEKITAANREGEHE